MKFDKILKEAYVVDSDSPRFNKSSNNYIMKKDYGKWSGSLEELERLDNMINKFHNGKIYIEFAASPTYGKDQVLKLIVKFEGDTIWLMNHKSPGPTRFESIENFLWSMKDSFEKNTQYVDLKAAYSYVFDYRAYEKVETQIREFADNFPAKAKSLTYDRNNALPGEKNSAWDMEVIFKRKTMLNRYYIQPSISGEMNYGRIIGKDEVEIDDTSLFAPSPKKKGLRQRNK